MGKFVIDNVLIEKSEKDINTGVKYDFSDGFNLICGNNEAGKSSLMKFIREGFFKVKDIDTGKVYFRICDEQNTETYRADIKDARAKDARCKVFDSSDNACDYGLIEKSIKQKYFEEGFTINLDDLMKIQNKDTAEFIGIIKDPSGDKLNSYLENIKEEISAVIALDGKLKKSSKEILDKISSLDIKIKELTKKESSYFDALASIREIKSELSAIAQKEEYLKLRKELNILSEKLRGFVSDKEKLACDFNPKLFFNKSGYMDLIQMAGKYSSNLDIVRRSIQKIEAIEAKIAEDKMRLNIECGLTPSEESINSFDVDYERIKKIKDIVEKTDKIYSEIKSCEAKAEDVENILLKLKFEIENTSTTDKNIENIEELEKITSFIEEGLKQYHYLSVEIGNVQKENIVNAGSINGDNKLQILLGILFVVTVLCAIVSFCQKIQTAGIFSILMSILALAGFSSLKLGSYVDKQDDDKNRKIEQRKTILEEMKSKIKTYYSEIDNIENSYLPIKLDSLKQEILMQLKSKKEYSENLLKVENDKKYNEERLKVLSEKINDNKQTMETLNQEAFGYIDERIANNSVTPKKYLEAVELLKALKSDYENKNLVLSEMCDAQNDNDLIINSIKNFIVENNLSLSISEDFQAILTELKRVNDRNNGIKQSMDTIDVEINNINKQVEDFVQNKMKKFADKNFEVSDVDIDFVLDKLSVDKNEKLELLKEAEFKQRDCIKYEGITDLKTEKNILIGEYRKLMKKLFINKMTLELTGVAKADFDRTQPDLINAQKYLEILTDGKYTKINLELEELESADGTKIKKWEHLSRGTKEQLYFALRLGYASNYAKDKTTGEPNGRANLPLIVDDAFVNFDAKRTKNALQCLKEFSKTNQVLYFTCHSEQTQKYLSEINFENDENINVINL